MIEIIFADNTSPEIREEVLRLAANWKQKPKYKLIEGHGINDSDYMTAVKTHLGGWQCPFYTKWSSMLRRVYNRKMHIQCPTYIETQVHPDWHSFMNFRKWCLENGWKSDYHLDKDFISDSKVYSPNTCAFIPQELNKFITDSSAARGDYPIGVAPTSNGYYAYCSNPFTRRNEYIPVMTTPEEAHQAWKKRKHQHALALAEMFPDLDPRVLQSLRTRYL